MVNTEKTQKKEGTEVYGIKTRSNKIYNKGYRR